MDKLCYSCMLYCHHFNYNLHLPVIGFFPPFSSVLFSLLSCKFIVFYFSLRLLFQPYLIILNYDPVDRGL